ncbi:hypothetical protein [Ruegeria sp. HKCCD7221]|uniref:hypothetical protein n=1 Tax=Ruegeria sp. HKCCD7221 TaxID=2683009 RepID=UPI00147E4F40|nr:hypothetical protein [Ruegeria sp. HKCCD7221]
MRKHGSSFTQLSFTIKRAAPCLDYDTAELRRRALIHPSDATDSYQLPDLDDASNADPKNDELMNRLDRIERSNEQLNPTKSKLAPPLILLTIAGVSFA